MKNVIVFDYKKLLARLFRCDCRGIGRMKIPEREIEGIQTNKELRKLLAELKTLNQKMAEVTVGCCPIRDFKVENIILDKVIFESIAVNMGNIAIDELTGTMNIGLTVNLSSVPSRVPAIELSGEGIPGNNGNTVKTGGRNDGKKPAYRISFSPMKSSEEVKPKISRIE